MYPLLKSKQFLAVNQNWGSGSTWRVHSFPAVYQIQF